VNEEALAHWGLLRQKERKKERKKEEKRKERKRKIKEERKKDRKMSANKFNRQMDPITNNVLRGIQTFMVTWLLRVPKSLRPAHILHLCV
jgi:predicted ThiF/HesA family dinucleotide-utilizing enzyme